MLGMGTSLAYCIAYVSWSKHNFFVVEFWSRCHRRAAYIAKNVRG